MLDDCRRRLQRAHHDTQMQQSLERQRKREEWFALCHAKAEEYCRLSIERDKARGLNWRFPPDPELHYGLIRDWDKDTLQAIQGSIDRLRAELRDMGALDARLADS